VGFAFQDRGSKDIVSKQQGPGKEGRFTEWLCRAEKQVNITVTEKAATSVRSRPREGLKGNGKIGHSSRSLKK